MVPIGQQAVQDPQVAEDLRPLGAAPAGLGADFGVQATAAELSVDSTGSCAS